MIPLYILAALASLSIPVLSPKHFGAALFPSQWVPLFLLLELVVSAVFLKVVYPRNDFVRCLTFGLIFIVVRMVLCFFGSLIDPEAGVLWETAEYRLGRGLVPALTYMYSQWYITLAQYVSLLFWVPGVFEAVFPGIFPPRRVLVPVAETTKPGESERRLPAAVEAKSFRDLERELRTYPGLLAWMVFSPERLQVWRSGDEAAVLEAAPEILGRMGEACRPILTAEWGGALRHGLFQTDSGYCLLTTLPGNFLFASLWRIEPGRSAPGAVLQEAMGRMEKFLRYRFSEIV